MQAEVRGLRSGMASLVAIQGTQLFASFISGATQAARSMISMGAAQAGVIDDTNKLAARLGFTYGELAGLANAGALVDVSMETIGKATQKAEIAFAKAAGGSTAAAAAFESIGLSVDNLNQMTAAERFQAIAQAISQLPTEAERAAAAVRIFGRSGVELLPMFQQGAAGIQAATAEAQRFGLALSQAQADNVDAMGDSFDRAQQAINGVVQQVVAYLAPAIESVTTQFSDLIGSVGGATIGQTIGEGILQGARFFATIADTVIANLSTVWEYVSQVGGQWSAVFEIGSRVASFFSGVGNALEAAFGVLILGISGPVEALMFAAEQIGNRLGFDMSGLESARAGMSAFNEEISSGITANLEQAGADFNAAIFGSDQASQAGQAIAGPLTTAVDSAIAAAQQAALGVDQATAAAIQRKDNAAPKPAAGDAAPTREALRALEVRSAEGIREMNRLMRQQGPSEAQKQTNLLQRIADNTEDSGEDIDIAEFAPAAGT